MIFWAKAVASGLEPLATSSWAMVIAPSWWLTRHARPRAPSEFPADDTRLQSVRERPHGVEETLGVPHVRRAPFACQTQRLRLLRPHPRRLGRRRVRLRQYNQWQRSDTMPFSRADLKPGDLVFWFADLHTTWASTSVRQVEPGRTTPDAGTSAAYP
jgi:hypothetical protein